MVTQNAAAAAQKFEHWRDAKRDANIGGDCVGRHVSAGNKNPEERLEMITMHEA